MRWADLRKGGTDFVLARDLDEPDRQFLEVEDVKMNPSLALVVIFVSLILMGGGTADDAAPAEILDLAAQTSERWVEKGEEYLSMGMYNESIASFDKALEVDPENAIALNGKGFTLLSLGQYNESISHFDRAIEIDPENDVAWNNKGFALMSLERYDESLQCFNRSLEIDPEDAFTWNNKGSALLSLERYEESLDCFEESIMINSFYVNPWILRNQADLALKEKKKESC